MKKKPDFTYLNENGKKVCGSAAFNHFVHSVCGGVEEYNKLIGMETLKNFYELIEDNINSEIEAQSKRSNIKIG